MKANEIKTIAMNIYSTTTSAKEIKNQYKVLAEQYGTETARAIVDKAREIRAGQVEKVTNLRDSVIGTIDAKSLEWEFEGLKKDREYKALAGRAACKCSDVVELVAKWYPHTIDGIPARKVTHDDGTKTWEKKDKINASATLKACLRQIAKMAKGAKAGTTKHEEGEIVASK